MLEQLTKRELEILKLTSEGLSNKEIMNKLFITKGTVKAHFHNIYEKLEIFYEDEQGIMKVKAVLIYLKESKHEKQKEN